jgi:ABC-type branched-subunit amino acid transport system substrate-binding protein
MLKKKSLWATVLFALTAAAPAVADDRPGVTATEIKIGNTSPYSGPASGYSVIAKLETAFFKMVNDQGGVAGHKINFISLDDGYSPPKTLEQVRRLIEEDQVALLFNTVGAATNSAIQRYVNQKKVPDLFLGGGADNVLLVAAIPKFAAQAIRKVHDLDWKPLFFMSSISANIATVIRPAGPENAIGIITAGYLKDPNEPTFKSDAGMNEWRDFMAKYMPGSDTTDGSYAYAYAVSKAMLQVLKQCEGNFTRENIIKQAANLHDLEIPTLLPGIKVNTSPTNYHPIRQMQLSKFDGTHWVALSDLITGAGNSLTADGLIDWNYLATRPRKAKDSANLLPDSLLSHARSTGSLQRCHRKRCAPNRLAGLVCCPLQAAPEVLRLGRRGAMQPSRCKPCDRFFFTSFLKLPVKFSAELDVETISSVPKGARLHTQVTSG